MNAKFDNIVDKITNISYSITHRKFIKIVGNERYKIINSYNINEMEKMLVIIFLQLIHTKHI